MGKPEAYVENYLRDRCREDGYMCMKFVSPGNAGVPDRIIIGHGEVFFVETKAKGQKPRQQQVSMIEQMRANGAEVHVIDTREGVDELLASRKLPNGQRKKPEELKKKPPVCRCVGRLEMIK